MLKNGVRVSRNNLIEPIFSEKNDFIDIEFYRTAQENTKDMVLELLKQNPNYTKSDLMKLLTKADGTIKQHIGKE